jgi:mono/diheme cytochrome c family protein
MKVMPTHARGRITAAVTTVLLLALAVACVLIGAHNANSRTVDGRQLTSTERQGAELFTTTCQGCHALKASSAVGLVGPSLDYVQPTAAQVKDVLAHGSQGAYGVMPSGLLSGEQANAVAAYVARVADRQNVN